MVKVIEPQTTSELMAATRSPTARYFGPCQSSATASRTSCTRRERSVGETSGLVSFGALVDAMLASFFFRRPHDAHWPGRVLGATSIEQCQLCQLALEGQVVRYALGEQRAYVTPKSVLVPLRAAHRRSVIHSNCILLRGDIAKLCRPLRRTTPILPSAILTFASSWPAVSSYTLGEQMLTVAIGWELYNRTHSALALGLIGLVQIVPVFLFSLPAGQIADRFNRKLSCSITQSIMGIGAAILATSLRHTGRHTADLRRAGTPGHGHCFL